MLNRNCNFIIIVFIVITSCTFLSAETLIEDNYPGYAENPDWQYDWIRGVGSVVFDSTSPGFAHLLLDGPGSDQYYHNAELYQILNHILISIMKTHIT